MFAFLDWPRSVFLRRALFQVHLGVGVLSALYLIVISVTGAALMFRIHLQRAVHPDLFAESVGDLAEPAIVLERVRDLYRVGRVSGIDAPTTDRPTYGGAALRTVYLDQFTGARLAAAAEPRLERWRRDHGVGRTAARRQLWRDRRAACLVRHRPCPGVVGWEWPRPLVDARRHAVAGPFASLALRQPTVKTTSPNANSHKAFR